MAKKSQSKLSNHNELAHDELMSGSFWMTQGPIDADFYDPLLS